MPYHPTCGDITIKSAIMSGTPDLCNLKLALALAEVDARAGYPRLVKEVAYGAKVLGCEDGVDPASALPADLEARLWATAYLRLARLIENSVIKGSAPRPMHHAVLSPGDWTGALHDTMVRAEIDVDETMARVRQGRRVVS